MSELPGMDDYTLPRNDREYYEKRRQREDDISEYVAEQVRIISGDNLSEWYSHNKNELRQMIIEGIPDGVKPENMGEVKMIEIKINGSLFPPVNYLDLARRDIEDFES